MPLDLVVRSWLIEIRSSAWESYIEVTRDGVEDRGMQEVG